MGSLTGAGSDTGGFMSNPSTEADLRELVQRYRVCWEVLNENMFIEGVRRQIGFCLELIGTHRAGIQHPQPGCEHCRDVYRALERIALWITPKEIRPSTYEIRPFDSAIRYEPAHKNRPEIVLRLRILHRSGFGPVDACEVRCLNEMKEKLLLIGAQNGAWSQPRKAG